MSMDVGTNEGGFRWLVEDERALGRGFTARVWRESEDDEPRLSATRSGFSTREAATRWAGEFDGSGGPDWKGVVVGAGMVVFFAAVLGAVLVRLATAPIVIGGVRETKRDQGRPGRPLSR